jgi:hypothetical protein
MRFCESENRWTRKLMRLDFSFSSFLPLFVFANNVRLPSLPHSTTHCGIHLWEKSYHTETPHAVRTPEPETSPPHSFWPSLSSLNRQSLARLRRCLLDPETTLATDYPRYTDEEPHVPLNLTDVQDEVGVDTRPCSLTSTKVILGNW